MLWHLLLSTTFARIYPRTVSDDDKSASTMIACVPVFVAVTVKLIVRPVAVAVPSVSVSQVASHALIELTPAAPSTLT